MKQKVEEALKEQLGESVFVERARDDMGDYATNIAFSLAKEQGVSPVQVAEALKEKINSELFDKIEVKNGFLNLFISDKALQQELMTVISEGDDYGREKSQKKALIDYSSPNIAKSFGVGHLRSTIIGQSLYNIFQFLGYEVVGVNHLGDWGTQYGKLLYQIKKEGKDPATLTIKELEEMYVRFHKEAEEDKSIEEEGRNWFSKLEKGDQEARRIWEICREKSLQEFNKVYKQLQVEIDYVLGESFYEDKLQEVIEEAKEMGVAKESDGALIIEFDDMPPAMIEKSDKSTTYLTRDLAAVKYRLEKFNPDIFLYEIGSDQTLHLRQLFATVEKMGWSNSDRFVHIAHGMFRLKEGKFSTRKGRTVHLDDVLNVAYNKAREMIEESSTGKDMNEEEKEKTAQIVGVGAVKYNDLKRHHRREVVFDWDQVITLKGDSGPYLQYTCVRCKSIVEKSKETQIKAENMSERERKVVKRVTQFKEVVKLAKETYSPNLVADYAHSLAKDFNAFYDEDTILGNPQRVATTTAVFIILKKCLHLLTIAVPDRM